jgi:hypothetical protein
MDRDEAIRLLKGGWEATREWNRRREEDEKILQVDLRYAELGGAYLNDADLTNIDLRGADLRDARLQGAVLDGAFLGGVNLTNSDLFGADLSDADLSGADLSGAYLGGVNLSGADLSGADFTFATCSFTKIVRVDLSRVKGLEWIKHEAPSTVDVDTLVLSRGRIPEAFLRGCGVPETLIAYLPSIIGGMEPIQFYSCFISYSTKDQDFAERLYSRLRDKGLRVWFAPEDIQGGKMIHDQLERAIQVHDRLLLVLSEHSIHSKWVETEIVRAHETEKREGRQKLFPIRLVDFEMIRTWRCPDPDTGEDLAREVRKYHIPDFSNWKEHDAFESAFARLIRDLKAATEETEGPRSEGAPERP